MPARTWTLDGEVYSAGDLYKALMSFLDSVWDETNDRVSTDATLVTGDIEIGAVELKDATTDNRVIVTSNGDVQITLDGETVDIGDISAGTQTNPVVVDATGQGDVPITLAGESVAISSLPAVDSADIPTTPNEYNVTLSSANTEYSRALPATCRALAFRCRNSAADVRYAWTTGKVAGPTSPYQTLAANAEYFKENIEAVNKTIYLASATAGVVVEIEAWS